MLGLPGAAEKHFEVVETSEEVLRTFQRGDIGVESPRRDFSHQLGCVAQLLHCEAHIMQSFRRVQRSRGVDTRPDASRSASHTCIKRP
jgi:hypothetical protein